MGELNLGAAAEATVQAYKELANDPTKRFALSLDETCIQFLAYIVAEGTGALVQSAVDTLELLSQNPECRPSLANTFGVLEALQEMADDARYSEELRNQTASLFTCLQFSRHATPVKPVQASSESSKEEPSKSHPNEDMSKSHPKKEGLKPSSPDEVDSSSKSPGLSILTTPEDKATASKKFLGPHNSKAKTITLFIKGMVNQRHRQAVEEELVRVRGLISIVFDLSKSRVTCRVKKSLTVDKLAAAVSRTVSFEAQQVIQSSAGEEMLINIGEEKAEAPSPVEDLPDYLPEDDSPVKESSGTAVASTTSFKDTASSFLSAAANLLQNSFYW